MEGLRVYRSLAVLLIVGAATANLTGCSTSTAGLRYESTTGPKVTSTGIPISVGTFVDQRGETPTWLGVIRGGFGNPIKTLEGDRPVAELVQESFTDGLKARGYEISASAPVTLSGTVRRLDADQYVRREANVEIVVRLKQNATGTTAFESTYSANRVEGSAVSLKAGIFGSLDDLQALLQKTLGEVIDKALDDPQFRTALNRSRDPGI